MLAFVMQVQSTATACNGRRNSSPTVARGAAMLLLLLPVPEHVHAAQNVRHRSHGQPYPKEYLLDVDYIRDADNPLDQYEAETEAATAATTTKEPFDCNAGLAKWRYGWSEAKKVYCCKSHNLGCSTKDEDTTAAATTVADTTVAATTAAANTAAPTTAAPTVAGATTTTEEFDCQTGLAKWRLGWSAAKKAFCCKAHNLGCDQDTPATTTTEQFDCQEGLKNWRLGWSGAKKKFCCKSHGLGCNNTTNSSKANASNCTTIKPPRPAWFAGTAPEGSRCLFGLDDRDEDSHCIIDDPDSNGPFGWCWTKWDKSEWGACSEKCPLFGQYKLLKSRIKSAEKNLMKLRRLLTESAGSSNVSLVEEATDQENEHSMDRHHTSVPLALLDAGTESTLHDKNNITPPEKRSLRGLLRSFAEHMPSPQGQIGTAFLQLEAVFGESTPGTSGKMMVVEL